jgi:hypothetical protein
MCLISRGELARDGDFIGIESHWTVIGGPPWDAFECFIESAMAAEGTMLCDQVVYTAHIEFSLSNRSGVEIAREAFLFIPICGLEEQAEPMERRAYAFRHDDLLDIEEGKAIGEKLSGEGE